MAHTVPEVQELARYHLNPVGELPVQFARVVDQSGPVLQQRRLGRVVELLRGIRAHARVCPLPIRPHLPKAAGQDVDMLAENLEEVCRDEVLLGQLAARVKHEVLEPLGVAVV